MTTPKNAARALIESLPEQASWDEIMYRLYVEQKIETGLKAADQGRTVSHADARRQVLGNGD